MNECSQSVAEAYKFAPEMFYGHQVCQIIREDIDINSIVSLDQIDQVINDTIANCVLMLMSLFICIILMEQEYLYWIESEISVRNVSTIAILLHIIATELFLQAPAYVSIIGSNIEFMFDRLENYSKNIHLEEILGIGIIGYIGISIFGAVAFNLSLFVKVIMVLKLKKKAKIHENLTTLLDASLVVISFIFIIRHEYWIMTYFSRYIGMSIFIPQIVINLMLENTVETPKLPVIVWSLTIFTNMYDSFQYYYINSNANVEITALDLFFFIRDISVLLVLYFQSAQTTIHNHSEHANNIPATLDTNIEQDQVFNTASISECAVNITHTEQDECDEKYETEESVKSLNELDELFTNTDLMWSIKTNYLLSSPNNYARTNTNGCTLTDCPSLIKMQGILTKYHRYIQDTSHTQS
eukprot:200471_1